MTDAARIAGAQTAVDWGVVRGRRGRARPLDQITFDLSTGELSGSLGGSGTGGTTTLEALSALLGCSSGEDAASRSRRRPSRGRR